MELRASSLEVRCAATAPRAAVAISWRRLLIGNAVAKECPHPAWEKLQRRGRHFVIATNDLADLEEVADWARAALAEPPRPLTKAERQGYQAVVARTAQWCVLEPLGPCHFIASGWRPQRLQQTKVVSGKGAVVNDKQG